MTKGFFLIIFLQPFFSFSQTQYQNPLIAKLENADSIKIISHKITEEYDVITDERIEGDSANISQQRLDSIKRKLFYPFLIDHKINPAIIIESKILDKAGKEKLVNIFDRLVLLTKVVATCDQPQHTILIYKNQTLSYIDICFGCRRIHTSKDINFSESNMDIKRWNDFLSFFKSNGLVQLLDN